MNQTSLFQNNSYFSPNKTFHPDNWGTPDAIAQCLAKYIQPYNRILEPAAGRGQIAKYLPKEDGRLRVKPLCIEIDPNRYEVGKQSAPHCEWLCGDFFSLEPIQQHDCIVMNPPFSRWSEMVIHSLEWLADGVIVALLPTQRKQNQQDAIALAKAGLRICKEYAIIGRLAFLRDGEKPKNTDNYNTSILVLERGKFSDWETKFIDPLNKTNNLFNKY